MHIVVDARVLANKNSEAFGRFLKEMFGCLILKHPGHRFSFFLPFNAAADTFVAGNATQIFLPAYLNRCFLGSLWSAFWLPRLLKKMNTDIVINCGSIYSLRSSMPQCLVVHDLGFLRYPVFYAKKERKYLRKNTPKLIKDASVVVAISELIKKEIVENYQTHSSKIEVVNYAVNKLYKPLSVDERAMRREKYTEGEEYFLVCGGAVATNNIMALLKAFSIFKRRQKNAWKLVIAGKLIAEDKTFVDSLTTYKYRSAVVLAGGLAEEELARLIAASYAVVDASFYESLGRPAVEAMQSGVAIIAPSQSAAEQVAGDAALFVNPTEIQSIAEKLLLIYKDENLRSKLIGLGMDRSRLLDVEASAGKLWACVLKAGIL